jgi:hypothetical protein
MPWRRRRSEVAEGQTMSVRVLAWLTAAHLQHHLRIIAERIGCSLPSQRRLEA